MNSGSFCARHSISISVITWLTRHLSVLTAGEFSSPVKCSGTFLRSRVVSSTRWKSTCSTSGFQACIWKSRSSTFCVLPPSSISRIDEWKASFFSAKNSAL